ncbi:hypothetical protein EU805_01155 [Salipiger sp. IMCC34102]|uniref:hypothetical protein n=1 Tax=Salipiger sp. IMCC34102 TaxID=2510647 RepID=UPI00101CF0B2|nr:hypothetical protein [Salipiger sp. IMCC34102]RYH04009.1 hypothetical protein EU805_01155 [Salipiger sp. IMCC34102]
MTRFLTTCTLVLALTLPAPVTAESFDQEDVGKALFAALAAVVVSKLISEARDDEDRDDRDAAREPARVAQAPGRGVHEPPVVQRDRGGLPEARRDRGGLPEGRTGEGNRLASPPREIGSGTRLGATRDRGRNVPGIGSVWSGHPLPAACRVAGGVFGAACLIERMPLGAPLPQTCRARQLVDDKVRDTYDAACLREAGYRTPRR